MDRDIPEVCSLAIEITVEYAVARPVPSDLPPPLMLIFHGWGQTCSSIIRRFTALRDANLLLVAPQAPHPFYVTMDPKKVGFTWLTQYERDRAVDEFRNYIRRLLERLKRDESFDPTRIVIAGYSQGVSMAYRLAISDVLTPTAFIACNADLPADVMRSLPSTTRFPVLLIHGKNDPLVPLIKCEEARQILTQHAFPIHQYLHEGGHELPPTAIQHIATWLDSVRGQPPKV